MSELLWRTILDAIPDVARWNRNLTELKRLADLYGEEFRRLVKAEAARRGYLWDRQQKRYVVRNK